MHESGNFGYVYIDYYNSTTYAVTFHLSFDLISVLWATNIGVLIIDPLQCTRYRDKVTNQALHRWCNFLLFVIHPKIYSGSRSHNVALL